MKNVILGFLIACFIASSAWYFWPAYCAAPPLVHYDTAYLVDTYKADTIPNGDYLPAQLPPGYNPYNEKKAIPHKQWTSEITPLDTASITIALQMLIELRHWQASNSPTLKQTCNNLVASQYMNMIVEDHVLLAKPDSVTFVFQK